MARAIGQDRSPYPLNSVTADHLGETSHARDASRATGPLLKKPDNRSTCRTEVARISERLITTSVNESCFWDFLIDEIVSHPSDPAMTPQLCEVALLRSGHSQLQSDQTAAAIYRCLNTCRRACEDESPRLAEQLRLRYSPLKQAYEAYGPGIVRSIGNRIWNGAPPKDWWPGKVTVHAVQPIHSGAAGRSSSQTTVWIEAVLTDISPLVPEWLRLVQQLTEMAVDTHTRTHASNFSNESASTGTELPWSLAMVPLVLEEAKDRGLVGGGDLPLAAALDLWQLPETQHNDLNSLSIVLGRWWTDIGSQAQAFPIALKQLSAQLVETGHSIEAGGC